MATLITKLLEGREGIEERVRNLRALGRLTEARDFRQQQLNEIAHDFGAKSIDYADDVSLDGLREIDVTRGAYVNFLIGEEPNIEALLSAKSELKMLGADLIIGSDLQGRKTYTAAVNIEYTEIKKGRKGFSRTPTETIFKQLGTFEIVSTCRPYQQDAAHEPIFRGRIFIDTDGPEYANVWVQRAFEILAGLYGYRAQPQTPSRDLSLTENYLPELHEGLSN